MGQRALSEENCQAFLVELNALIEEAAESCARSVVDGSFVRSVAYPPDHGFSHEEVESLQRVRGIPSIEPALRKMVADACANVVFHALCVIDGVGDPRHTDWSGVSLLDSDEGDAEGDFLHDGFLESYWEWREIRPVKGWYLDASDTE